MKKEVLVKMINSVLRKPWSDSDIRNGKEIHCMPSWFEPLRDLIPKYLEKGWIVKKNLSISSKGRNLSLIFKHPEWSKKIQNRK